MKISFLQENLLPALREVRKAIITKPQLPILSAVLLTAAEEIVISGTDLYFGVQAVVPGVVSEKGVVAIPARPFWDILQTLSPGKIEISLVENTLTITSENSSSTLSVLPADEYPEFPAPGERTIILEKNDYETILQDVSFAASLDETRPTLTAIFLSYQAGEKLQAVATDGFRLSLAELAYQGTPDEDSFSLLIPSRSFAEILKVAQKQQVERISFSVSEEIKQLFFSFKGLNYSLRLLEGEFPPYQKILPKGFTFHAQIDCQQLQSALRSAAVFARESSQIVTLKFSEQVLTVTAQSSSLGKHTGTVQVTANSDEEKIIAFNVVYVLDLLSHIQEQSLWFGMNESLQPAVFKTEEKGAFTYVVMPFKLNEL